MEKDHWKEFLKARSEQKRARFVSQFDSGSDTDNDKSGLLQHNNSDSDSDNDSHHTILNLNQPRWMPFTEDIRYDIQRIENKMKELSELHDQHLLESFGDPTTQEQDIDILTRDITRLFRTNNARLKTFSEPLKLSSQEETFRKNIGFQLARELQDLSVDFRQAQKVYLQKLRIRESKGDLLQLNKSSSSGINNINSNNIIIDGNNNNDLILDQQIEMLSGEFTDEQLEQVKHRELKAQEQSKEILEIVRSINDLASIMDDLAFLVVDQGSLLDRIDYNIEQVEHYVEDAVVELQETHQAVKKTRTKMCIFALCIMIILVCVVIILKALIFK